MSTKATLVYHAAEGDEPAWRLYEEIFEPGVVYLQMERIGVELSSRDLRSPEGGVDLVLRLPIETATQLGLPSVIPTDRWKSACNPDKDESLRQRADAFRRLRESTTRKFDVDAPGSEEP